MNPSSISGHKIIHTTYSSNTESLDFSQIAAINKQDVIGPLAIVHPRGFLKAENPILEVE